MDAKKFGEFIAERRRETGMTQAELAAVLGVTDKAVSRWERGRGFPDINTLEPLSAALGLSVPELMRSEKSAEAEPPAFAAGEVTQLMQSAVEIARQSRHQDKTATLLVALTTVSVAAAVRLLTNRANLGGALMIGFFAALAAAGLYLFMANKGDRDSRRIYGAFFLGGLCALLYFLQYLALPAGMIIEALYLLILALILAGI